MDGGDGGAEPRVGVRVRVRARVRARVRVRVRLGDLSKARRGRRQ